MFNDTSTDFKILQKEIEELTPEYNQPGDRWRGLTKRNPKVFDLLSSILKTNNYGVWTETQTVDVQDKDLQKRVNKLNKPQHTLLCELIRFSLWVERMEWEGFKS